MAPGALRRRAALGWAAAAVLAAAGCAGSGPSSAPDIVSLGSYDRSFDSMVGALTDQKLAVSRQDRRAGTAVGTDGGAEITGTLSVLPDGSYRVSFRQSGEAADRPDLLKKVVASFNERMAKLKVLTLGEP
ncbi:MAG TPA: hypothetical protein P5163_15580 [Rubrivivax sp.]|nr:hypothetical protein [Rubrivivax sp.]HRZ62010.1 hypothetical protein [Rubrivivax sp.]